MRQGTVGREGSGSGSKRLKMGGMRDENHKKQQKFAEVIFISTV
jgi:hypothetical protein